MARKLNDIQLRELDHKKAWCLTAIEFMMAKYGKNAIYEGFAKAVVDTHAKNDLKGMRCVHRDVNEWARSLARTHVSELNALLKERFGENLLDARSKDLVKIDRIRKRGKIRTENEFRLVHSRAEQIWDDETKRDEMQSLNKLLADFECPQ